MAQSARWADNPSWGVATFDSATPTTDSNAMKPHQADLTRQAVAIMTAWVDSDSDSSFGVDTLTDILRERGDGEVFLRAVEVIGGFVNLTALLMIQRYRDTGQDELATLRLVAAELCSGAGAD